VFEFVPTFWVPRCHWYVNGAVPVAVTENVAVWPTVTVLSAGCVVIWGTVALPGFPFEPVLPHAAKNAPMAERTTIATPTPLRNLSGSSVFVFRDWGTC